MDAFEAVSSPELSIVPRRKYFTISEANRALNLVGRIVSDIVRDYKKLRELHTACQAFDAKGNVCKAEEVRRQYASITDHLSELNEELEKIGCELKDYRLGLVYFPSMQQGREVCLCWKLGEEQIMSWHPAGLGYPSREPIGGNME
ncbi:MAG: DUF2203 domain-containing protein [Planctomycetota bacterium]|nr:MAG: DUF2203 domain-containing protein [Planctomycetota bacterium]